MPGLLSLRAALRFSAALAAAVFIAGNSAQATPIDVSQTLSRSLVSSQRSMDPLVNYAIFPWPYAYVHQIDRLDRFTNTSLDTVLTITQATALTIDPEALGFSDLTPANRADVEQAAAVAHTVASFWDIEDLPFAAQRAGWNPLSTQLEDGTGKRLSFPLTLAPQQSALLHSGAFAIGAFEGMGEMVIGWEFEGSLTGATPPTTGDVNRDGRIDLADFGVLKANFGAANATWANGDLNGDGQVSLEDFGVLKQAFGKPASAAPEPSSALLAIAGAIGLLGLLNRGRAVKRCLATSAD